MGAFAADVTNGQEHIAREFVLYAEVPLLHVRPEDFVWDGNGRQRAGWPSGPLVARDVGITRDVVNGAVSGQRRRALLQEFGVGFVAIHVLEEDAITATDGPFAVTEGIIGKTQTRAGIHVLIFQATCNSR